MAVTVAVGGLLCFLGLARAPVLVAWICGGVALLAQALLFGRRATAAHRRMSFRHEPRRSGWELLLAVAIAAATAFIYLGAAGHTFPNPSDDWPAYLPLVRKLLQTGTLIEPFSVRRMAAYGGQTLLQALTLVVAKDSQIQIFDGGICLVLTVGLIFGFAREARNVSWTLLLLTASAVLMLPDGRANSASEMSGVVGFVTLWRTATLVDRRRMRGPRAALLVALPAAAVATLRQNYLLTVAIVVVALLLRDGVEGRTEAPSGESARRSAPLFLAGRALFWRLPAPLGAAGVALESHLSVSDHPRELSPGVWRDLRPHDLGSPAQGLLLRHVSRRAYSRAAARSDRAAGGRGGGEPARFAGALAGDDGGVRVSLLEPSQLRQLHPRALSSSRTSSALVIVAGLAAAEGGDGDAGGAVARSGRGLTAVGLVATALALQIYGTHEAAVKGLNAALDRIHSVDPPPPAVVGTPEIERRMQAAVPPKARLLVMIDRPYLLDFARNPIEILDQPGAASPAPGIPLVEGAEKVALYLQAHGIRYVGFVRPDKAVSPLYSRAQWQGTVERRGAALARDRSLQSGGLRRSWAVGPAPPAPLRRRAAGGRSISAVSG